MIVNLRGNNGSGKTTIVKKFLAEFPQQPLFAALGPKYPEAYKLTLPRNVHLYVLGPYHSRTGGIDALSGRGFDQVLRLLDKYKAKGHVLFEGVVISTSFGSVGAWLEKNKKESIVAFLDTPLEVCLSSIRQRTGDEARQKHVQDKDVSIARVKKEFTGRGMCVETISRENAFKSILGWLR
jgi:hypothetical protein